MIRMDGECNTCDNCCAETENEPQVLCDACLLPEKDELPEVGNKATVLVLRTHRPPDSFFAWAQAEVQACENSGWKDDAYVGAGFRLGELREYLKRVRA